MNSPIKNHREVPENKLSLQELTRQLLTRCQPDAVNQGSFFINDVPPDLIVEADISTVSELLGSLLCMTGRLCRDTCIKISAKAYHDVILMHIKDTSTFNNYAIRSELQHLQMLAGKIGGYVELTSQRKKETTIAFSFINRSEQNQLLNSDYIKDVPGEMNERNSLRA
jgi:hypothetical protein